MARLDLFIQNDIEIIGSGLTNERLKYYIIGTSLSRPLVALWTVGM